MYTKTDWNIGTTPAINETNLDKIEGGIERAHLGTHIYGLNATGNDTYVLTFSPVLGSYNTGLIINLAIDAANTGAATLNINSLGAKDIKKRTVAGKVALITGDLTATGIYTLIYDGTDFIVINPNLPEGIGTAYQQLGTNAGATANEFQNSATSVLTTTSDILYASSANTLARKAKGSVREVLGINSAGSLEYIKQQTWDYVCDATTNQIAEVYKGCCVVSGYLYSFQTDMQTFQKVNLATGAITALATMGSTVNTLWGLLADDNDSNVIHYIYRVSDAIYIKQYSISGNSWSALGSAYAGTSLTTDTHDVGCGFDATNNRIVLCYEDNGTNYLHYFLKTDYTTESRVATTQTVGSIAVFNGTKLLIGTVATANLSQFDTYTSDTVTKEITGNSNLTFDICAGNSTKTYVVILARYTNGSFFIVYDSVNNIPLKIIPAPLLLGSTNNIFFTDGIYIYIAGSNNGAGIKTNSIFRQLI